MNILLGLGLVILGVIIGMFLLALISVDRINESESLVRASRKSLRRAEDRITERNKLIKTQREQIKEQKERIKDLENNVEFLFNNLSAQKKKLVIDGKSKN